MSQQNQAGSDELAEKYEYIKKDVKKVFWINLVFLALLVILYFVNREYNFVSEIGKLI